jgi:hypothetical protein
MDRGVPRGRHGHPDAVVRDVDLRAEHVAGGSGLGLGATLTTRHLLYEAEVEAALGLPPGVHSYAILPIGYPMGRFGPVGRGPLSDIVYEDHWGHPYSAVE